MESISDDSGTVEESQAKIETNITEATNAKN